MSEAEKDQFRMEFIRFIDSQTATLTPGCTLEVASFVLGMMAACSALGQEESQRILRNGIREGRLHMNAHQQNPVT